MERTLKNRLGGGALEPKTVARVSEKAFYKKKKKAFTLAEVLITLAIIGVVAALTIPTVVAKYQQKAYYTQFMKVYNTLSNALSLAQAEHGTYDTWFSSDNDDQYKEVFIDKMVPYIKVAKICDTSAECGVNRNTKLALFNIAEDSEDILYRDWADDYECGIYVLSDGTLMVLTGDSLEVDINGPNKGPNTIGRDIFEYDIRKINEKYVITLPGLRGENNKPRPLEDILNDDDSEHNCSKTEESYGWGCGARLLLEGKMDY